MSDDKNVESPSEGVFGEGFAAMFAGSPHGEDSPKAAEAIDVEVPGKTEAKTDAEPAKADDKAEKPEAKPDADKAADEVKDKPAAPPGLIAERRRAQAAERQNQELSERLSRQEQALGELLGLLQQRRPAPDFVTNPEEAAEMVRREAAQHARAEAQRLYQAAEAQREAASIHQTANSSQEAAAKAHGEETVIAALDWAKMTGRSGPQSPYIGSQDPYGDLVADFTKYAQATARAGGAMPSAKPATTAAQSQVRIPPSLASATPAGAAAQKTVKDHDSWFTGDFLAS